MLIYALKRVFGAIPTLLLLMTLTFFLMRLAPGGPFDSDRAWPPDIQANINHHYELDQPIIVQYAHWMTKLSQGDLGESFQYLGKSVNEMIEEGLPVSLTLGSLALLWAAMIGIPLGCFAAWKKGTFFDSSSMFIAIAGVSLPSYLVATVLILVFSFWLGILPPALWENPGSAVLPIITLGLRPMAMFARLTRASMLEALQSDYIRTAQGKGLGDTKIIFKHALKNSMIPLLTVMGPAAANLVTGSFLVEMVFQLPGLGRHFVQAVLNRDYPLVMGVTLVYGVILIFSNLGVDLLCAWTDPRIRLEGRDE